MAVDNMVKRLLDERDGKLALIDQIAGVADDEGRDLLESESQTISNAQERVRSLNAQVDRLTQDLELAEGAKSRIRTLDPSIIAKDFNYRSAGDLMWDLLHRGDDSDANMRFGKYMKRAAEHMGFDKANTVAVAGGFNGLVTVPSVGPVLDPSPQGRPLFTALGARPAPALTFTRPRLYDPNVATGVGPVAKEKAEMASKAWDILNETVTCSRIGGYINVSEVLVELLSGSLDMVIAQMNHRVERYSETWVYGLLNASTATVAVTTDNIQQALADASALVIKNTGAPPTWLAMGADGWSAAVGLLDLAGRPLFPFINPANAIGSGNLNGEAGIPGLRTVVSNAIPGTTMFMGNSFGLEIYERPLPLMQAFEPSVYGRQVAVATFLGSYAPITTEAVTGGSPAPEKREGVVKITWA